MANIRQHREPPDLIQKIADLERRVRVIEGSRRLGNASIDGGRLTLRNGDLAVVDEEGTLTLLLSHGNTPAITMLPSTFEGGYIVSQFAWEDDNSGATYEVRVENSSGQLDGGKVLLNEDTAYLSRQPQSGAEVHLALGEVFNYQEHIRFKGRWVYNDGFGSDDAVVFGYSEVVAGFGGLVVNFPFTFDMIPIVVCNIYNAGALVTSWNLTALSASGFTISWSGALAKTVMWAAFRR